MIDPLSFLILILLSFGLSQIAFAHHFANRLFWMVVPGIYLLFVVHPLALLFALACFCASTILFAIGRITHSAWLKSRLPYMILLLLFVPDISLLIGNAPILWLGSAFFIIRQMMTTAQAIKSEASFDAFIPALLIATFFVAALPSGPVFHGLKMWREVQKNNPPNYAEGFYRLFEGFVYLFAIAGFLSMFVSRIDVVQAINSAQGDTLVWALNYILLKPLVGFGFLFATFYGYSRMAEGTALLFGFEVPQNFNKPHLARDLGDFWKRWHRSMAEFVMQYIYLPLLVTTSRTKLALISAFGFMGLWHNFSLSFLIWGVGHGLALSYALPWAKRVKVPPLTLRITSLAYVVFLSAIAHGVWTL
ncbi:MBOAT family O-acyltransferase [uncultured Tateyamaria sp.]|uniref:MBOAT family O-acyltransferase n=1 Tax=uncultured Tateyamaria sp. TaxID=455651 RepID=UPI002637EF60|nr:MBOAT family O-acyltransferase [uncultured Tateyamaria sp.]